MLQPPLVNAFRPCSICILMMHGIQSHMLKRDRLGNNVYGQWVFGNALTRTIAESVSQGLQDGISFGSDSYTRAPGCPAACCVDCSSIPIWLIIHFLLLVLLGVVVRYSLLIIIAWVSRRASVPY